MKTKTASLSKSKPKCSKGTKCGDSCISKEVNCIDKIGEQAKKVAELVIAQITGEAQRAKGSGAGSASLTEADIAALLENEQFLSTATSAEIVARAKQRGLAELSQDESGELFTEKHLDKVVDAVWLALPAKTKTHLKNKGSLANGNYLNPSTGEHEGPNEPRAKLLLRRFIEQNGRDAYTGQPISLTGSDLEHIEPFGKFGKDAERADNFAFVSTAVNQRKAEKSLPEFYAKQVRPEAEASSKDPSYWAAKAEAAKAAQGKKNAIDDMLAEKSKDSWQDGDVDQLGSKYYYAGRALGHLMSYEKTRPRGVSGQTFNMKMGSPLVKAFAAAYRDNDQPRIAALEAARVAIVDAAKAESKVNQGNAGKAGGGMEAEYEKQRAALGW